MGITVEQMKKAILNNASKDIEDREIVIGLTHKGQPFPALLSSWLIGGMTQNGKSCIAPFLIMWFVMAGAYIVLMDPHLHNKKRGLYSKIEPLKPWFARPAIDCLDVEEILAMIDWLEAEYKERKRSMIGKAPLLLVIDEFNELLSSGFTKKQSERIATVIGNVARGGSKHGMFVLAIGHNFDLASAGGNAVRRNIIGRVSVNAEVGEMCNILDTTDRTKIKQLANIPTPLRPGQAIVKVPGWGLYRLYYPLITAAYLADFTIFMQKTALFTAIPAHEENNTPTSLVISIPDARTIHVPPINTGEAAINPHKSDINLSIPNEKGIAVTPEEQAAIEAAAMVQIRLTGGVNRTQLRRDLQWEKRYKAYEKIKLVCDFHNWRLLERCTKELSYDKLHT